MSIKRRDFLKTAAGSSLALAAGIRSGPAEAKEQRLSPEAVGILYDSNLCIGCQACMTACKQANDMPVEPGDQEDIWDRPLDLSATTLNIIKMYDGGETPAFVKRQCLHCLEPACVTACPVSALEKDQRTGVVTYDKKACIGCRYCQIVCPYNVPKFEWDDPFPQIRKCQFCDHLFDQGRYSACCESCPTGASLFGPFRDLKQEAERRLQMEPGRYYEFPVNHIGTGKTQTHKAEPYVREIYGAEELGGTQVLLLSGVDFTKLGLPKVRNKSYVSDVESISSTLYSYMLLPAAVFGGLLYVSKRNGKHE
ncbi:MAG: hydrogenase 2 operon protein HybA [Desulfohalobiaceae bacterium]|nr:hydrogenase 2 operon protein HybA [Desulfohalobiaceae bacterium]